jgi:aminomethyltransferase
MGIATAAGLDAAVTLPEVYPVQIQGPKARPLMLDLVGEQVESVRYYWTLDTVIDDIPVVISRTGWTGEIGYEVYLTDPSKGDQLWERIMSAGAQYGIRPIAPCEARRIEAGIFNYNSDMTLANNPFEVSGLERLVEHQETDYIGKQALERIRVEGVARKLVGIEVTEDWQAPSTSITETRPVLSAGEVVGHLTDLTFSPRLGHYIGYVWVPIELAQPGNALEIAMQGGERIPGRTASIPFIDPQKKVPAA